MYTILLDSSNTSLGVGIAKESILIGYTSYEAWQQQSEFMIPEINKLLEEFKVKNEEIDKVVVAIGPGSYTGVRIALTIAKIMAFSLNIPLYPVSSLHILKKENLPSICVVNARSNRSYVGIYHNETVIMKDTILTNDEVKQILNDHPEYTLCGVSDYLGIEGYRSNTLKEMLSLLPHLKETDSVLGLTPVYLKD